MYITKIHKDLNNEKKYRVVAELTETVYISL